MLKHYKDRRLGTSFGNALNIGLIFNKIYQIQKMNSVVNFVFLGKIFKSEKVNICNMPFGFGFQFCPGLFGAGSESAPKSRAAVFDV